MAICVEIDSSGVLHQSATAIDSCNTYVLMDSSTYTSLPTLTDVFSMPLASDLAMMFQLGFSLPVICYITAWAFQTVIDFISRD